MREVYQTRFSDDERGGNCVAACLASLFEISIDDVPDFDMRNSDNIWVLTFGAWLRETWGLDLVHIHGEQGCDHGFAGWLSEALHLQGGPTARGTKHMVVFRGDKMIHDPHPDGNGLLHTDDLYFLVPVDLLCGHR